MAANGRRQSFRDDAGSITNDDGPSKKRMRISRACETCRRQHERCDGGQPICRRCSESGRTCSYKAYKKRGLRAGHVRGVEILLGLLVHSFDGAEDLILSVLRDQPTSQPLLRSGHAAIPAATSLLDAWRQSASSEALQKALAASQSDDDEESYLENLDGKLTSVFNSLRLRNASAEHHHTPVSITQGHHQLPPEPLPAHATPLPTSSAPAASPVHIEPPSTHNTDFAAGLFLSLPLNWSQLIDMYLTNTHCWLPIVPKYTLFRSASLLDDPVRAHNSPCAAPGEIASLWAVLAYGSYQLEAVQQPGGSSDETTSGQSLAIQLHEVAKSLAVQDQLPYGHGHIQASLVLSLLDISHGSWTNAWLWVGKAISLAISLKIVPSTSLHLATPLNDSEKRLFRGCFILDALLSTKLGLRPHLNSNDLHQVGDIAIDDLEEWETWRGAGESPAGSLAASGPGRVLSTFNHLGYLAGLLNVSCHISGEQSAASQLHGLIHDLKQRAMSIPASSSNKGEPTRLSEPPHSRHLRIAFTSTYVHLQTRWSSSSLVDPALDVLEETNPDILQETQEFLKSTPKLSPIFCAAWAPPTLIIFLNLLEQAQASSISCPLRHDWAPNKQRADFAVTTSWGTSGSAVLDTRSPVSLTGGDSNIRPTMTELLSPGQPSVHGDSLDLGSRGTVQHHRRSLRRAGLSTTAQISTPTTNPQMRSIVPPLPLASQQVGPGGTIAATSLESQSTGEDAPPLEEADRDALFNQLSLLDTSEWPGMSGDFMEHLGLPRDATLFDFQSLISP